MFHKQYAWAYQQGSILHTLMVGTMPLPEQMLTQTCVTTLRQLISMGQTYPWIVSFGGNAQII